MPVVKPPRGLDLAAIVAIERLLDAPILAHTVLSRRDESRLRFNAVAPVVVWRLFVRLAGEDADYSGEIEVSQWPLDGDWELDAHDVAGSQGV